MRQPQNHIVQNLSLFDSDRKKIIENKICTSLPIQKRKRCSRNTLICILILKCCFRYHPCVVFIRIFFLLFRWIQNIWRYIGTCENEENIKCIGKIYLHYVWKKNSIFHHICLGKYFFLFIWILLLFLNTYFLFAFAPYTIYIIAFFCEWKQWTNKCF